MYNLLVSGSGWAQNRDTMPQSRVFEYTDPSLVAEFENSYDDLTQFPTLFLEESFDDSSARFANVGQLTRIFPSGRDFQLEYYFDASLPAMTNTYVESISSHLGIEDFEFHRTHFAIKDVDLFKVLFVNQQPSRFQPTVFRIDPISRIEPVLVSAMMPFEARFDAVYQKLQETAEQFGLRCRRADDIWENPAVMQDVVSLIDRSRIVVCDCTSRNPNVFYEAGIAHTLGREVVLITQNESDIPFDLRHLRYIHYLNNSEGLNDLANQIGNRIKTLLDED